MDKILTDRDGEQEGSISGIRTIVSIGSQRWEGRDVLELVGGTGRV